VAGRAYSPGYLGNILVGGIASAVVWGIYGSSASVTFFIKLPPRTPEPLGFL
jgi:hypothetical protein